VHFDYPAPTVRQEFLRGVSACLIRCRLIRKLGHATVDRIWRLGFAARFLFAILKYSATSFRRLPLTLREIYFSGVLSLLIILVSGLFVGLVLGLQGYETCSAMARPRRWGFWSPCR
jgi:ABC-type transporter Mla maintaining outer membrane lipid asymmetry permease subunit MlaE